jgi:hypothetical protein
MRSYEVTLRKILAIASWHITSVEVARRNALVASTELAQRRLELREVEDFLAAHTATRAAREVVATG